MARKLRVQYSGAMYHIMNRGDRREPIFDDDSDRVRFVETLSQACEKTGWQVHAYCLMNNHFHLVIETPQPNLVPGMKWLLGSADPALNVLAELASGAVSRLGFEQGQFLLQFFGLGFDMGQAGLAVFGMNAVIGGVGVGDQGAVEALAKSSLCGLGGAVLVQVEKSQIGITPAPG